MALGSTNSWEMLSGLEASWVAVAVSMSKASSNCAYRGGRKRNDSTMAGHRRPSGRRGVARQSMQVRGSGAAVWPNCSAGFAQRVALPRWSADVASSRPSAVERKGPRLWVLVRGMFIRRRLSQRLLRLMPSFSASSVSGHLLLMLPHEGDEVFAQGGRRTVPVARRRRPMRPNDVDGQQVRADLVAHRTAWRPAPSRGQFMQVAGPGVFADGADGRVGQRKRRHCSACGKSGATCPGPALRRLPAATAGAAAPR